MDSNNESIVGVPINLAYIWWCLFPIFMLQYGMVDCLMEDPVLSLDYFVYPPSHASYKFYIFMQKIIYIVISFYCLCNG